MLGDVGIVESDGQKLQCITLLLLFTNKNVASRADFAAKKVIYVLVLVQEGL